MHSGVVRGECQEQIPLIQIQQMAQLLGTPSNVLEGIIDIGDPQGRRCIRGQLHQPNGSLPRHGILAEIRFRFDHCVQQCRIEMIPFGVERNRAANFLVRVLDPVFKIRFGWDRGCRNHHARQEDDEGTA
jgi:hypothetical protein